MTAVAAERGISLDKNAVRTLLGGAVLLTLIAVLAKATQLNWGESVEVAPEENSVGGKPIPKESQDEGAHQDPEKCKHPGFRVVAKQCGWCGALLH